MFNIDELLMIKKALSREKNREDFNEKQREKIDILQKKVEDWGVFLTNESADYESAYYDDGVCSLDYD